VSRELATGKRWKTVGSGKGTRSLDEDPKGRKSASSTTADRATGTCVPCPPVPLRQMTGPLMVPVCAHILIRFAPKQKLDIHCTVRMRKPDGAHNVQSLPSLVHQGEKSLALHQIHSRYSCFPATVEQMINSRRMKGLAYMGTMACASCTEVGHGLCTTCQWKGNIQIGCRMPVPSERE